MDVGLHSRPSVNKCWMKRFREWEKRHRCVLFEATARDHVDPARSCRRKCCASETSLPYAWFASEKHELPSAECTDLVEHG